VTAGQTINYTVEALRLGADYQYDTDIVGAQMHTLRPKLQGRF
jgi:hypothetical protein